jgi:hypothetical protein
MGTWQSVSRGRGRERTDIRRAFHVKRSRRHSRCPREGEVAYLWAHGRAFHVAEVAYLWAHGRAFHVAEVANVRTSAERFT